MMVSKYDFVLPFRTPQDLEAKQSPRRMLFPGLYIWGNVWLHDKILTAKESLEISTAKKGSEMFGGERTAKDTSHEKSADRVFQE